MRKATWTPALRGLPKWSVILSATHKYCARAERPLFLFFCSQSLTFATVFLLDNNSKIVSAVFMPLLVILIEAACPPLFHGAGAELAHLGKERFERTEVALVATVRKDGSP